MEEERMAPGYFQLILKELLALLESFSPAHYRVYSPAQRRVYWLTSNVAILEMFCMCLETWKYSRIIDEENEEIMERLRSVITSLKLIWPEDFTLILSLLRERMGETGAPIDIDSVMFEMEGKILQSKQQVEGWCRNMIHSSLMMMTQLKSSGFRRVSDFVNKIGVICDRRAGKYGPLGKQIDIFGNKIVFLQRTLKKANIH